MSLSCILWWIGVMFLLIAVLTRGTKYRDWESYILGIACGFFMSNIVVAWIP